MLNLDHLLRGSIKRLAYVNRYSSLPVIRKENVAEHTCFVSLYCLLIAKDLQSVGRVVDVEKLLKCALLHDIDESLSGDFLRSVKYGVDGLKDLLSVAGVKFVSQIQTSLGVRIMEDWKLAKDDSIEGYILSISDLLGVLSYLLEEYASGNQHIIYIFRELSNYFALMKREISDVDLRRYIAEAINVIEAVLNDDSTEIKSNCLIPPE